MTVITLAMVIEHLFIIFGAALTSSLLAGLPLYRTYESKFEWFKAAQGISGYIFFTFVLIYFMTLVLLDSLKVISL